MSKTVDDILMRDRFKSRSKRRLLIEYFTIYERKLKAVLTDYIRSANSSVGFNLQELMIYYGTTVLNSGSLKCLII